MRSGMIFVNAIGNLFLLQTFRSIINKYKKTELTKKVNAENTVEKTSRDNELNDDDNFVT